MKCTEQYTLQYTVTTPKAKIRPNPFKCIFVMIVNLLPQLVDLLIWLIKSLFSLFLSSSNIVQ